MVVAHFKVLSWHSSEGLGFQENHGNLADALSKFKFGYSEILVDYVTDFAYLLGMYNKHSINKTQLLT